MRKLIPFLFLFCCGVAFAQVRIPSFPAGLVPLQDGWRMHVGDNPAWSDPAFDDSSWQPFSFTGERPPPVSTVWYRLHVEVPQTGTPLALAVLAEDGLWDFYVNGQRSSAIEAQPWWRGYGSLEHTVPLPANTLSYVIAIRFVAPTFDSLGVDGQLRASIGSSDDIRRASDLNRYRRFVDFLPSACVNVVIVIAGIGLLLLFLGQRQSLEYFWLGIYLLLLGTSFGLFAAVLSRVVPGAINDLYSDPAIFFFMIAQIEFTYAFIQRKPSRVWRIYECILLLAPILTALNLSTSGALHGNTYYVIESLLVLPAACAIPILLLYWYRRGNREAGWLIVPSLFPAAGVIYTNLSQVVSLFHLELKFSESPVVLWSTVPIKGFDIADAIFLLAIGIVMFVRFSRVSEERARASAELEAARAMQQRLVPAVLPVFPGSKLEAVYLPAAEVGGDFYQVLKQPDGAMLLVIGDVSGKGLRAAMTGAMVIGALRALAVEHLSPGLLLARLNQELAAEDSTGPSANGFVTCLCVRIDESGQMICANAGHLPPYRNGVELATESSLPLGLVPNLQYPETIFQLAPGDKLTLITDGVLEATSPTGELFGFDRTQAISMESAEGISRAAQAFGQDDDITVLTLIRA